ncbi:MAG: biosynthetic-type acetolactate synthase large subunit [Deltaproteobacteria bacterium]|nr:biosynthetic-type acetolactate synthase large subunit [Deltaproteobacteria bacterium]
MQTDTIASPVIVPRKKIKGSRIIISCLEREGVDTVFGYPGGASMDIHQALTLSKKIRVVLPRHEQGAAFAASGYARATGKPGVCLAASGPGATNLITGIMDARLDSIPMVILTGQVATKVIGTDAFQETDIVGATLPCVKHSYLMKDVNDISWVMKEAFHLASSNRPGPVLIDFPVDIQQALAVLDDNAERKRSGAVFKTEPAKGQIKKALGLINEAQRPVIYAGGGIISGNASDELRRFVKKTGIPVTTTSMGLGAFPEDDPLSLHMLGMHGAVYANMAIARADLVIALGTRFDNKVTGKISEFCKNAKIIHVDIDASEINKNTIVALPIQGDVRQTLEAFNTEAVKLNIEPWINEIQKLKKEFAHSYPKSKEHIVPQAVIVELSGLVPNDAVVCTGVGQHQMWTAQFFKFKNPRSFISSCGLGAMGFGLPAAIGAQVAFPNRMVIDIDGDGSFLMNIQELQTLKTENIPVKCVVLNNSYLGMMAQWEDRYYKSVRGHTCLGEANFAEIAKAFGIAGATVSRSEDVAPALKEMLSHKGAYVLDVKYPYNDATHGHVLPMIPADGTYLDSILPGGVILRDYLKQKGATECCVSKDRPAGL